MRRRLIHYLAIASLGCAATAWAGKPKCVKRAVQRARASIAQAPLITGVRADVVPAVQAMFEAGPNRWIALPHASSVAGESRIQRGMSGGMGSRDPYAGVSEAMDLFAGLPTTEVHDVSEVQGDEHSETIMRMINGSYSLPMSYRSRTDRGRFVIANSRVGIATGLTIDSVQEIGLFSPSASRDERYFLWGRSYLRLYDRLQEAGMILNEESRGARFIVTLRGILQKASTRVDRIGVPDNVRDLDLEIRDLVNAR